MRIARTALLLLAVVVALVATGCATKKYVSTEVAGLEAANSERMDGIESQVEANQSRLDDHEKSMGEISTTAQEALDRAIAAGKLAEGTFLFETVFSDDKVQFGFDESNLSDTAKQALDIFVEDLKSRDESVYIEIQGHTDSTGPEAYNLDLGQKRAEAVRRHLNQQGIPLARMSVISYGMSAPIADNATSEGRAINRRVTIVVLK